MISNCGFDERGQYTGGSAGDQTGREWEIRSWYQYSGGWEYMIRHPNRSVGKKIAELAKAAAANNHIGYDQSDRYTFWQNLAKVGYNPAKITANCEADCSSGCAAIAKAVGYLLGDTKMKGISIYAYTGNIRQVLQQAGFDVYTSSKYLTSDAYLMEGDFLLKPGWHICTVVTDGSAIPADTTPGTDAWKAIGTATCTDDGVNVRATPGGAIIGQLFTGQRFEIDGQVSGGWTHVKVAGIGTGWMATQYIKIDVPASPSSSSPSKTPKWVGASTTDDLNVRTGPGIQYRNLSSYPKLNEGNMVDICDTAKASDGSTWYYIRIAGKYFGYVSGQYIRRV